MPYIKHKLGQTFYLSKGRNKRPPLIALHGGPGSGHNSLINLFDLAEDRKVYVYDQIGCGKSSKLKSSKYAISTFVEELCILKKKWGIEQFHLFGTSWGTTLALEYYLSTKDTDCLSITFQSPLFSSHDWKNDAKKLISYLPKKHQKIIRYCHEIGATDSSVYKDAMHEYYRRHVCRNPEGLKAIFSRNDPDGKTIYTTMWGPSEFEPTGLLKKYDRINQLKNIDIPSLLVCGKYDEARPETVSAYADRMQNATFKVIPKSSHVILRENKEPLLRIVNKHIYQYDS